MATDVNHDPIKWIAFLLLAVALHTTQAYAQDQGEYEKAMPSSPMQNAATLDKLFVELKSATNESEAEHLANMIDAQFRKSGSDTLDLLAARAREAMGKGDLPVAIEILSRILVIQPDWAEAWNLRATAFFLMGDQDRAKADAIETLAREPRHFGALTGLALIFEIQGQQKDALRAYRQVLVLGPQLKPIKSAVTRLAKEIEQPM